MRYKIWLPILTGVLLAIPAIFLIIIFKALSCLDECSSDSLLIATYVLIGLVWLAFLVGALLLGKYLDRRKVRLNKYESTRI